MYFNGFYYPFGAPVWPVGISLKEMISFRFLFFQLNDLLLDIKFNAFVVVVAVAGIIYIGRRRAESTVGDDADQRHGTAGETAHA